MGAKASTTATSGHQSPRSRTFSSSSTGVTDIVAQQAGETAASSGFNLLRTLPGLQEQHHLHHQNHTHHVQNSSTIDRQRARSLSSVPDMHQQHHQQGHQHQQQSTSHASSPGNGIGATASGTYGAHTHLTPGGNHYALGATSTSSNHNNNQSSLAHHSQMVGPYSGVAGSSSSGSIQQRLPMSDGLRVRKFVLNF